MSISSKLPVFAYSLVLCSCSVTATQPNAAIGIESQPFQSLRDFLGAIDALATAGNEDFFWQRVQATGHMPLVFGEHAVFLYRGEAERVEWRGDFTTSWQSSPFAVGNRIGNSQAWWKIVRLEDDARLDYKIVVDGKEWLLDPMNPHTQLGGYGANSEARMPAWAPSPYVRRRENVYSGDLSDALTIESKILGYALSYRVYTPAGLAADATGLASLYVTDGSDYSHDEMGSMLAILDNLYASRAIEPIVVVFIDAWDPTRELNRRAKQFIPRGPGDCTYCAFLQDELIPTIDARYPTERSGAVRGILGTSLGGLLATYLAATRPTLFNRVVIQSPAYGASSWLYGMMEETSLWPERIFYSIGAYETRLLHEARSYRQLLEQKDCALRSFEVHDGHSWGNWRALLDDALVFLYPATDVSAADTPRQTRHDAL